MRAALVSVLLLLGCASTPTRAEAAGQTVLPGGDESGGKARVMVLGTLHLHNPGADYAKHAVRDVMSPEGQAEVLAVVSALERFRPTKIAVEWPAERADALDAEYARYREGALALTANEIHQLAFRLAGRLGHSRLYAIDVKRDMDIGGVMQAAAQRPEQAPHVEHVKAFVARFEQDANAAARRPLAWTLRLMNDPRVIDEGHALYLRFARLGGGEGPSGADEVAGWLERNLRIYVNLTRLIASPGERVLVLYGAGHAKLLRDHVLDSDDLELVDPRPFLPE